MGRFRYILATSATLLGVISLSIAQQPGRTVAAGIRGSFTTSSKLFFNPDAASEVLRGQFAELDNVYGLGIELRWRPFDSGFFLGLTTEYLSGTRDRSQVVRSTFGYVRIAGKDGYRVVPIELSGNVYVPLGTDAVRFAVGGGIGGYFAQRLLSVGGVQAQDVTTPFSFGIHVRTTFEYRLIDRVLLSGELRFRDPEATTTSRFVTRQGTYQGVTFQLPDNELRSKVSVDGMNLALGILVEVL